MEPISDKLQNYTDRYSFVKRRGSDQNVQKYASCAREIPDWGQKMLTYPIGDMTSFSGENENQSISVINTFFLDHLRKI